jgi:hypothetical protein
MRRRSRFCWAALLSCSPGCGSEAEPAVPAPVDEPYSPHTAGSDCAGCHPNHVREWQISPHAYAMVDPVFHAMVRLGQAETEGELDQFCTKCHSPLGVETGETRLFFDESAGVFRQRTEGLSARSMMGVSCESCHSIVSVEERFNAGFTLELDGVRRGPIMDPVPSSAHESEYSQLISDSDHCGSCHNVVNERFTQAVAVEQTMIEWVQSVFNGARDCQDCHMPEYLGQAAPGGPERRLHRHLFVGVDVPLVDRDAFPGYDEMRDLTTALLQDTATLTLQPLPAERRLAIRIQNFAGHKLPSGATADRECWIELRVKDASGTVVFESGTLDENGDLRVDDSHRTTKPGTDPELVLYSQRMYFDPALEQPPLPGERQAVDFLWQPNAEVSNLVPTGGISDESYDLSSLGPGTYTAEARLLFRSFPPHLLRKLEHEAALDPAVAPRVPTVEMETGSVQIVLP